MRMNLRATIANTDLAFVFEIAQIRVRLGKGFLRKETDDLIFLCAQNVTEYLDAQPFDRIEKLAKLSEQCSCANDV